MVRKGFSMALSSFNSNFVTKYSYNPKYSLDWDSFATEVTSFRTTHENDNPSTLNFQNVYWGDRALSISHVDGRILIGTYQAGTGTQTDRGSKIWRSDDKGQTWNLSKSFHQTNGVYSINHLTGDILLATTGGHSDDGEVWKSINKGNSWYNVSNISTHDAVYQTAYMGNGVTLFGSGYNNTDGEIWRSTNYGEQNTWTKVRDYNLPSGTIANHNVSQLCPLSDTIIIAVAHDNDQLLRSTDAGLTWSVISGVTPDASYLCNLGGGVVILSKRDVSGIRFYRSSDYGQNWSDLGTHLSAAGQTYWAGRTASSIFNLGNNNVICVTYIHGAPANGGALYLSNDNGQTWNSNPVFNPSAKTLLSPIIMDNDMFIAGRSNGDDPILYHIDIDDIT